MNTCHAQLVIDSLDGEVTQHEVDTFISNVSATTIPTAEWTATITHNQLADGNGGQTLEAINYMYQITGDIPSLSSEHTQLLNLAIAWNDAWLTHRNDLPLGEGRVMWTGNVEPVWPPNCPTCTSSTYYESEVGDTIGHMAFTAYNILNSPSIWNNTVPDGDPNNFGTTYLARAKTYVSMLEFSMSNSFTPYFIDPNTLLIKRPSTAQGYQSSFHVVNAWNVQMMLLNAYWRLAQCHFILGDNPSLAAEYKTIVQKSTDMFVQNAQPLTAPDGTAVFDWGYCNFGDCTGKLTGEQNGVHAAYDMWGLTRAYGSGYSTVPTAAQMKTYADTVVHEITLSIDSSGAATYASFNDRCCSTSTYNYLPTGFVFLTPYNTDIYKPAANADINSGRLANSPGLTADVLWMKHWIFSHSQPPDFTLSAGPTPQTVTATASASYTVSMTSLNGFTGAVNLSLSGLPAGATFNFSPASISGSASSTLAIATSCATPAGTYTLTITGTSGSLSHSASVTLIVNATADDFTIAASPPSSTVTAGGGTSYTVNVGAVNCFVGTINLIASGFPSGVSGTLNPTSINGSGSSTLSISTSSTASTGPFTLTITGASGNLSHSATVGLTVNPASSGLPSGWSDADIGSPALAGSASFANGAFTVNGSGADIYGASDQFHYASQSLAGDITITARVSSQQNTNAWAKSGVMIRETTAANASFVHVFVTPGHGVNMQYRSSTGANAVQLAQTAGPVAPYWVRLVRSGNTFTGFASADGATWAQVGTISVTMAGNVQAGLAVTSHNTAALNTSTFDNVAVSGLPTNWSDADIGSLGVAGSASASGGVFTVNGSGADIYGTSDNFNYASETATGDVTITARVASQQNTNLWAKSGVMVRETTAANASFVHVFITPGHGVNMQYRNGTGASAVQLAQVAGPVAPYWVRVVRSGNTFTGFASADGVTWTQVGSISVSMASNVRTGLAVTAHNNTVLNTSTFDNVTIH
jgi:regulation of enolase protein 1 (concanavalin A-like superfamily)